MFLSSSLHNLDALDIDYFTKFKPSIIISSARRRHWPVTVTGVVTALLEVTCIISTGLLELQAEPLSIQSDILASVSKFSSRPTYNRSVYILYVYIMAIYNIDELTINVYLPKPRSLQSHNKCWLSCQQYSIRRVSPLPSRHYSILGL